MVDNAYHQEIDESVSSVWDKHNLGTVKQLKARLKEIGFRYARISSDLLG